MGTNKVDICELNFSNTVTENELRNENETKNINDKLQNKLLTMLIDIK